MICDIQSEHGSTTKFLNLIDSLYSIPTQGGTQMKTGEILVIKEDKLLVLSNNRYYIVKGEGEVGDKVEFDIDKALPMPSYLFAIAAIEDEDLEQTMKFIKSEWFKD